jgi:SAM-dependent methyltransferase
MTPPTSPITDDLLRQAVRERYAKIAQTNESGREPEQCAPSCCGPTDVTSLSLDLGYTSGETASAPATSNLGLGCGNPGAIASIRPGETVLDLGSGAGFDCFLAAQATGPEGRVIGVDMTQEMVSKARANASDGGYHNVEFRLGEIEHLPVADSSVDVIISNCVINLSPDKPAVWAEALRVLRPGGRVAVSDVVAFAELPPEVKSNLDLYAGCMSGAASVIATHAMLTAAGFGDVSVAPVDASKTFMDTWAPGMNITDYVVSASIQAVKPL